MNGRTLEGMQHVCQYKPIDVFGADKGLAGIVLTREDNTLGKIRVQEQAAASVKGVCFADPAPSMKLQYPSAEKVIVYPEDAAQKVKEILHEEGHIEQGSKLVVPARELPGLP